MMAELRRRDPEARFTGLLMGGEAVRRRIADETLLNLDDFDDLDKAERKWVDEYRPGAETELLRRYEEILGPEVLNRIHMADRIVGARYNDGGCQPLTRLRKACDEQPGLEFYYLAQLTDMLYKRLEQSRPEFVFSYCIAAAAPQALELIAPRLGIKFRTLSYPSIYDVIVLDSAAYRFEKPIRAYLAASDATAFTDDSRAAAKALVDEFKAKPRSPGYSAVVDARYRRYLEFRHLVRTALATVKRMVIDARDPELRYMRRPTPLRALQFHYQCWRRARRFNASGLAQRFETLDTNMRFAFYPLHVNPEASTMGLTPMMMNQLAVIEALAKALPPTMKLLVKEHFPMLGKRTGAWIERLTSIPKVILIDPRENGMELVRRAELVAVLTGTAAWEAMLLERRVLFLGESWRRHIRGAAHCFNFVELPRVVSEVLEAPPVAREEIECFIAAIIDGGLDCPIDFLLGDAADIKADPEAAIRLVDHLLA